MLLVNIIYVCISGLGTQVGTAPVATMAAGPARVPKRPGAMPPFALFSQVDMLFTTQEAKYIECWPCLPFNIFCSIRLFLPASLVTGRRPE
jgi:hypothetical protein